MLHPWHDVSPGENVPHVVEAMIEIPRHSRAKYELDKATGLLRLDRVLYSAVYYPANYGFIPQTYCPDDDPLDILVICNETIYPMTLVEARVVGVMRMLDSGAADDKIIAVANNDMTYKHIEGIEQVPEHWKREIRAFFEDYKRLENKEVRVEAMQGRAEAEQIVSESLGLYQQFFQHGNRYPGEEGRKQLIP